MDLKDFRALHLNSFCNLLKSSLKPPHPHIWQVNQGKERPQFRAVLKGLIYKFFHNNFLGGHYILNYVLDFNVNAVVKKFIYIVIDVCGSYWFFSSSILIYFYQQAKCYNAISLGSPRPPCPLVATKGPAKLRMMREWRKNLIYNWSRI